jgi:hypothetical protein
MRPGTAAAIAFIAATCLTGTVVMAAAVEENALHSHWLPDSDRTPGITNPAITQANVGSTICVSGWTKKIRPPASYTNKIKRQEMSELHLSGSMKLYELDHLISLEIGGNPTDPKNLWPEPWNGTWGAHKKDRLENELKKLVCNRTITLREAQTAIASNWIAAYKRYVLGSSNES